MLPDLRLWSITRRPDAPGALQTGLRLEAHARWRSGRRTDPPAHCDLRVQLQQSAEEAALGCDAPCGRPGEPVAGPFDCRIR
jgi:hypothetical protein